MITRTRAIIERRGILGLLIARDLKIKYANSALGYLWSLIDPLMMALVYWFVFTVIFHRAQIGHQPYIVFLLAGLLPWNWASAVMSDASQAITAEAKLVRSTSLPREIWVLRLVGSRFAEFAFSLPVLVGFMVLYGVGPSRYAVYWPLAVLMEAVLLVGIALMLAPLTVMLTDLQRLVRIVLRVMFYLSPVIYGVHDIVDGDRVPEVVKQLYALNPFAGILDLYRAALFPQGFAERWEFAATAGVVSVLTFFAGAWVFSRLEGAVLKEI